MNIFRYQQFDIQQEYAAMKVGTDSDLLGTLGAGGRTILDIGTGTGVLSLMMAQRYPEAQITAVEIDDNAVRDASANFSHSRFSDRISLHHLSFQDFLVQQRAAGQTGCWESVICNPPYFDRSLECPDLGRSRARHSSSLPFEVLAQGAYELLCEGGCFSVCIPPEVLEPFCAACQLAGFSLQTSHQVKSLPHKPPKRYVLIHQKGAVSSPVSYTYCMRNADHSRSDWYKELLGEFLRPSQP